MQTISADIVIIGSGVGGSAVATQLARAGIKILILERGDFLPNEPQNSNAEAVFVQSRYKTRDEWVDAKGTPYRPGQYYYVGEHTKIITLANIPSFTALPCSAFARVILQQHRWMGSRLQNGRSPMQILRRIMQKLSAFMECAALLTSIKPSQPAMPFPC